MRPGLNVQLEGTQFQRLSESCIGKGFWSWLCSIHLKWGDHLLQIPNSAGLVKKLLDCHLFFSCNLGKWKDFIHDVGEEKWFSLYPCRLRVPSNKKNSITGEKQKFNNTNTSCIYERQPGKFESLFEMTQATTLKTIFR